MKNSLRRLTAGAGVVALALLGVAGSAVAASAEGNGGFPVVPDQTGSLNVHKHVKDEANSTPGNPAGAPIEGVEFSIQQLGTPTGAGGACEAIDLTQPGGWENVTAAIDAFVPATGAVPAGFCAFGAVQTGVTDAAGVAAFTGLKGLYLVTETDPGDNLITAPAEPFLVTVPQPVFGDASQEPATVDEWDFTVDSYPKNEITTVNPTKTVGDTDKVVLPGAVVDWTITVPVPELAFPYSEISVTDSPQAGHTFKQFTSVSYAGATLNGPSDPTPDYTVAGSVITLTQAGLDKVGTGGEDLVVNLETTVNADHLGEAKNEASVTLNGNTKPTTTPQTNWGMLHVVKHVKGDKTKTLAGAEFAVFEKTDATCPATMPAIGTAVTTGAVTAGGVFDRTLWISNTDEGEAVGSKDYCLYETKAPSGYVLDAAPRTVTISGDNGEANPWTTEYFFPNVPVKGPELPLTGSTGTAAFMAGGLGLLLVAGGAALVVARRKQGHVK